MNVEDVLRSLEDEKRAAGCSIQRANSYSTHAKFYYKDGWIRKKIQGRSLWLKIYTQFVLNQRTSSFKDCFQKEDSGAGPPSLTLPFSKSPYIFSIQNRQQGCTDRLRPCIHTFSLPHPSHTQSRMDTSGSNTSEPQTEVKRSFKRVVACSSAGHIE